MAKQGSKLLDSIGIPREFSNSCRGFQRRPFHAKTWYYGNKLEAGSNERYTLWHRFGQEEKDGNECEGKWKKVCNMGKAGEESNRNKNSAKIYRNLQ